eukprot:SAG31_NODE_15811_length_737_cov_6.382445_1_plen_88_part_00
MVLWRERAAAGAGWLFAEVCGKRSRPGAIHLFAHILLTRPMEDNIVIRYWKGLSFPGIEPERYHVIPLYIACYGALTTKPKEELLKI